MKTNLLALGLIVVAALWRVAVVYQPALFNIAPVTALAFCGAVFFRDKRMWLVPFGALLLSDLWLNHYHASHFGYTWPASEMVLRLGAISAALGFGWLVSSRRNVATLLGGALASSLVFFVATNTVAWFGDAFYAKSLAGWVQALTVGHPEFPPTIWFFRNTMIGDLLFTGVFAAAYAAATSRETAPVRA